MKEHACAGLRKMPVEPKRNILQPKYKEFLHDVIHPVINGINYQPQLVSRISEPSTVVQGLQCDLVESVQKRYLVFGGNKPTSRMLLGGSIQ